MPSWFSKEIYFQWVFTIFPPEPGIAGNDLFPTGNPVGRSVLALPTLVHFPQGPNGPFVFPVGDPGMSHVSAET
eukprot:11663787-Prorocentrum_lima.AAC.1